jgi:hypothetical protein
MLSRKNITRRLLSTTKHFPGLIGTLTFHHQAFTNRIRKFSIRNNGARSPEDDKQPSEMQEPVTLNASVSGWFRGLIGTQSFDNEENGVTQQTSVRMTESLELVNMLSA